MAHPRAVIGTLFSALSLSCAVAMPFRGPGLDGAPDRMVVVSLTHAVVDPDRRRAFDAYTQKLAASMESQPGLVGFSLRKELFGNEAWTMSAWESEEALIAFSASPAHREAVDASREALVRARFCRLTVQARELPLSWSRVLEILDSERESVGESQAGAATESLEESAVRASY